MSIKKIIVIIVVAIAVIVGGIFAFQFISTNSKVKETEKKLGQINAEELQEKLIKELESTSLKNSTYTTEFLKNKNGFVVFEITNVYENRKMFIEIPCFKIESNSNGNFKRITYLDFGQEIGDIVNDVVEKVFKDEYNININSDYNSHFKTKGQNQDIQINDEKLWQIAFYEIIGYVPSKNNTELRTITFGLK